MLAVLSALLLIITMAAAVACAYTIVSMVGAPAPKRVAAVIAVALLAVVPGTLCRVTEDLAAAMAVATALFTGAAFLLRRKTRSGVASTSADADADADADRAIPVAMPAWPAFVVAAFLVACVAHGAVTRNFFDEEAHIPFALVLSRGIAPPEHPLAMGQVVPYHWAIDALYAQLIVAGFRPDHAIDVVTVGCMLLLIGAASAFGGALAGRAGATLTTILAPLSGSLLALPLHEQLGPFQRQPSMYPKEWLIWTTRPPPLTADFFQHPQGLAFPIVLVVLLLATSSSRRTRFAGFFVLWLLSLCHAVHFLVLGFGLLVATLVIAWREGRSPAALRNAGTDIAALAATLVGALVLGGFFSLSAGTGQSLAWGTRFFTDTSASMLAAHHVVAFGLPLVLLPALVAWRPLRDLPERTRVTLLAGASLAFFLPNVVVYAHSWDIVKLYTAAGFAAGIAIALTFAVAWNRPRYRPAVALAVAVTIAFPAVWLMSRTVMQGRFGVPAKKDWRVRDDVLALRDALAPIVEPRARLLVNDVDHCRMTGFFCPGFDLQRFLNGHLLEYRRAKELMALRAAVLRDLDPLLLDELGVDYALLTAKDVAKLTPVGKARLAQLERIAVDGPLPNGAALYRIPR